MGPDLKTAHARPQTMLIGCQAGAALSPHLAAFDAQQAERGRPNRADHGRGAQARGVFACGRQERAALRAGYSASSSHGDGVRALEAADIFDEIRRIFLFRVWRR
jgi:hypothetical protein